MVPPEGIGVVGVKVSVTGTDLPAKRSDAAIVNDTFFTELCTCPQREVAVKEDHTETGVYRLVVVPSPTCAIENNFVSLIYSIHNTQQPTAAPKITDNNITNNNIHLAVVVESPA